MAAYASILLLAALCIGTAYSLQCYTCDYATNNNNCKTPNTCPSGANYCQTTSGYTSASGYFVSKSCQADCTSVSASTDIGWASVSCCSKDLCNVNGAVSIKSTYSAIFLVLGTIVMLFSSSLL